jgi:hypothetical protein
MSRCPALSYGIQGEWARKVAVQVSHGQHEGWEYEYNVHIVKGRELRSFRLARASHATWIIDARIDASNLHPGPHFIRQLHTLNITSTSTPQIPLHHPSKLLPCRP